MQWDRVIERIAVLCGENAPLQSVYGATMRLANATSAFTVPCLEWSMIGDSETELYAPMIVQFDQWVRSSDDLRTSERALRNLFHAELPVDFAGLMCFTQYEDGGPLDTPDRDGLFGRGIRFRITPLREIYNTPQIPS